MSEKNWTEDYEINCWACHETTGLFMVAHRIAGKLCGWIFTCRQHGERIEKDGGYVVLGDWQDLKIQDPQAFIEAADKCVEILVEVMDDDYEALDYFDSVKTNKKIKSFYKARKGVGK